MRRSAVQVRISAPCPELGDKTRPDSLRVRPLIFRGLYVLFTWLYGHPPGFPSQFEVGIAFLADETKDVLMKKIVLILSMCAFGVAAHAQQITHAVKANPIGFFAGQYQLGYEHGLTDVISAQVSAGLITGSGETTRLGDPLEIMGTTRSGFIVIPEIRIYPGGSACEGFYASLVGRYRTAETVDDEGNTRLDRSAIGGALVLGYQRVTSGYVVDFFIGPQVKKVEADGDLDVSELFNNDDNVGVRLGVNIGFGW